MITINGEAYNIGSSPCPEGESYYVETTGVGGMKSHLGVVRQDGRGRWELWYEGRGVLLAGFWERDLLLQDVIRYMGITPVDKALL